MRNDDLQNAVESLISAKKEVVEARKHEARTTVELVEQLVNHGMTDCFSVNLEKVARRTMNMSSFQLRNAIHGD